MYLTWGRGERYEVDVQVTVRSPVEFQVSPADGLVIVKARHISPQKKMHKPNAPSGTANNTIAEKDFIVKIKEDSQRTM